MTTGRIAFNPLPWTQQHGENKGNFDRQRQELRRSVSEMAHSGIAGVSLTLPEGMDANAFHTLIGEHGFIAAPGFFSADFDRIEEHAAATEAARATAEISAGLGVTEIFIACNSCPERYALPAQGILADNDRLRRISDGFIRVAETFKKSGVTAALHPHVGSWVETEAETRSVLDWSAGSVLGFGPDTGHLLWAGADLAALLRDYRNRIVSIHIKDVHLHRAQRARDEAASYWDATRKFNIWTEPGNGDVDFEQVFDILGPTWDGWTILEIDRPEEPTPAESIRLSLERIQTMSG